MSSLFKQKITGNSPRVTSADPEKAPNWKSDKNENTLSKPALPPET